jgi:Arc/MetJ-type ribon-helix-helix transcriptional regulator
MYANPHINMEAVVKTIQMTIDEPLLEEVDQAIRKLKTNRSAFIREALQLALNQLKIRQMEISHAEGYEKHPVTPGEFDVWHKEQSWSEK